jgi:hypothetical protein
MRTHVWKERVWASTHNISSDDTAVEIDPDSAESNTRPQSLGLTTQELLIQRRRQGMCGEDGLGAVLSKTDVILEQRLDKLLAGLLVMLVVLGNVIKGLVDGHEECEVGLGAVEGLDNVWVLADQLVELGGVVAEADEVVDGLIREVMVTALDAKIALVNSLIKVGAELVLDILSGVDHLLKARGEVVC